MQMHLKTVEVNAAALEAACVARGAAGGRAFPAKCNHQDLLSSLSVLPVPPGGKQRACLGILAFWTPHATFWHEIPAERMRFPQSRPAALVVACGALQRQRA